MDKIICNCGMVFKDSDDYDKHYDKGFPEKPENPTDEELKAFVRKAKRYDRQHKIKEIHCCGKVFTKWSHHSYHAILEHT